MKKIVALLLLSISFWQCSTVPLTGRKQFIMVPESDMISMSLTNYDQFIKENKISIDKKNSELVKSVGSRISKAVTEYMISKGMGNKVEGFVWEFNLVADSSPNAWCMPGGKVVFYEGILPFTQNADGIAVVMGHEIAHAIARHSSERISQQMLIETGTSVAFTTLLNDKPEKTKALYSAAIGYGTQLGVTLPFSRQHEYEADHLGLIFMTMAGYNPEEAVAFWQRMSENGGAKQPEFLSTHPADLNRVNNLKALLPEIKATYQQ